MTEGAPRPRSDRPRSDGSPGDGLRGDAARADPWLDESWFERVWSGGQAPLTEPFNPVLGTTAPPDPAPPVRDRAALERLVPERLRPERPRPEKPRPEPTEAAEAAVETSAPDDPPAPEPDPGTDGGTSGLAAGIRTAVTWLNQPVSGHRVLDHPWLTRRNVLLGATAAVVSGLVGGDLAGTDQPKRALAARARTSPRPVPSATPPKPPTVKPAALMSRPITTLAQYRRAIPGPAFPPHAVALTIDDGPHPVWTPKVLALLEHYHVQATFFMIGNQVRGHEAVARSVLAAGHHLANHTYSHPSTLAKLSPFQMGVEIGHAQEKIYDTTGVAPKLFRSPGGEWSPPLFAQAAQAGLLPIDWSEDPSDWKRPGTAAIVSRMLTAKPGQILLCHDGGGDRSETYAALQTVIPALLSRGLIFVSL